MGLHYMSSIYPEKIIFNAHMFSLTSMIIKDTCIVVDIEILIFLQDNQIRLSGRVSQYLIDRFEDNRGIDCERLYRFLTDAHMKSGQLLFFLLFPFIHDENTQSQRLQYLNETFWLVCCFTE